MHGGRGYRGWMAATTVAITLSLVFLVVEKHGRNPVRRFFHSASKYNPATTTDSPGILLTVNPGLAGIEQYPRTDRATITRSAEPQAEPTSGLLRRPPEPAANVVLQAPVAFELSELPLTSSRSGIQYLMDAMDEAFERPLHVVSAHRPERDVPSFPIQGNRLAALPSPASMAAKMPEPAALIEELAQLHQFVSHPGGAATEPKYVATLSRTSISPTEADHIQQWIAQTQALLTQIVIQHGLEHPASSRELEQLAEQAAIGPRISESLSDYTLAARVNRAAYALQRRVVVWQAIQDSLDSTSIGLSAPRNPELARQELLGAIARVEARLTGTGAAQNWREYLLLAELSTWANSSQDIWSAGNEVALRVLSRLHWQRLSDAQQAFLAQPEFENLAAHLIAWGRDPVDYRTLLTELEQLEEDPISRIRTKLAGAVQVLRLSDQQDQQRVATEINNHYRNANVRLSVADDLIQRFLPNGEYEVRPVRQRILGADTRGDSSVQTNLNVQLLPDPNGWHIALGVSGDMTSNTSSSKGPAVFHNTSTAQISSVRYLRLDPMGYQISSQPTNVVSQDYLRKMSTDFDGLPIIGDFVRLLVREQFDQKRGLAQRITRRLIAQETDAELDRRIGEGLAQAERELEQRLVGPLEALSLNPMVVSMNTTPQRLTIRYRVANEAQMAAHTPRPRAPSDAKLSMQIHQSAINNAIAQVGLSGRDWTLPELYERLGQVFQQSEWQLPDDVPTDIIIRFADSRPATVELKDGKLRLTLRIAKLTRPGQLHIERFLVSSSYVPVAEGLSAELIRDGVVEIVSHRDRLALRLIFAKVFVSRPQIPLISKAWIEDQRSDGLAVSQLALNDGWLAVAISHEDSPRAAEVAAKARILKQR